jgi:hypothetical protein
MPTIFHKALLILKMAKVKLSQEIGVQSLKIMQVG